MKFLSKLGEALIKGLTLVTAFQAPVSILSPKAGSVMGTAADTMTQIAGVAVIIEAAAKNGAMSNEQKLLGAIPSVRQILLSSPLMAGHKIPDDKLKEFDDIVSRQTSVIVDMINLFNPDAIEVKKVG